MFDLRHIENVVLDQAILHILDMDAGAPIHATETIDVGREETIEFTVKHILLALQSEQANKAKFIPVTDLKDTITTLLDENSFVEQSVIQANRFYRMMQSYNEKSCDLLFVRFHTGNLSAYGIIRLGYQKQFIHEINNDSGEFVIEITSQETALPSTGVQITQAVFGLAYDYGQEYDLIVLDRIKSSDEDEKHRFLKTFLQSERVFDYKDHTRIFRKTVEDWTVKCLKEDFETAQALRAAVEEKFRTHATFLPGELVKETLSHDTNARVALTNKLNQSGIDTDMNLEIDKRFVDKKMKSKTIKTDTGFVIKGDYELFQDEGFIEIQRNSDGSVNYLIKKVRHCREK